MLEFTQVEKDIHLMAVSNSLLAIVLASEFVRHVIVLNWRDGLSPIMVSDLFCFYLSKSLVLNTNLTCDNSSLKLSWIWCPLQSAL